MEDLEEMGIVPIWKDSRNRIERSDTYASDCKTHHYWTLFFLLFFIGVACNILAEFISYIISQYTDKSKGVWIFFGVVVLLVVTMFAFAIIYQQVDGDL